MGNVASELEATTDSTAIKKTESTEGPKINISESREMEMSPTEAKIQNQKKQEISNDNLQANDHSDVDSSNDSMKEQPKNPLILKLLNKNKNGSVDSLRGRHISRVQSNSSIHQSFNAINKLNAPKSSDKSQDNTKSTSKQSNQYSNKLELSRLAMLKKYRMTKFNSTSCLFIDFVLVNSNTNQYLK